MPANTFTFTGTDAAAPLALPGHSICQVIEEIARVFGLFERLATGGTTGTIIDTTLARYANDYWKNTYAYIKATTDAATPQAEESFVSGFVAVTGVLALAPILTAVVGAGDTYQLYSRVPRSDIVKAVARAVAGVEVASTLIASNVTLDYVLNCTGLYRRQQLLGVFVRPRNDVTLMPDQIKGWWLEDAEGILTLRMPYLLDLADGFWITYHMGEGETLAEEYHVNAPLSLLRARGAVYCLENLLAGQDIQGMERIGRELTYWKDELQRQERMYQRPSRKVQGFPWYLQEDDNDYAAGRLGIIT